MAERRIGALTVGNVILDTPADELEAIADSIMETLLGDSSVMDPSVMLNPATGEIEVEMLIPDVENEEQAKAIGMPALRRALEAAGVRDLDAPQTSSLELVPA